MKMSTFRLAAAAGASIAFAGAASAGMALEELVVIDLTTADQITVTATMGNSAVDASGSSITGTYFEDFYGGSGGSLTATLSSGDFTSANNPSDGSPALFRGGGGADPGLNLWSFSTDFTVSFTAGQQAFTGSATWTLDAAEFADMFAGGNRTGTLWFPADTADDISTGGAVALGTYRVIVPAPGAAALFGLAGLAAVRRRR
jgi:hypothetical protein